MDQTAIAAQEKKKRKLAFFQELDKLDEISDTEETSHKNIKPAPKPRLERLASAPQLSSPGILVPGSPDCVLVESRAKPKLVPLNSINEIVVKATPYSQLSKNVAGDIGGQMENSPSNRHGTRSTGAAVTKRKKATRSSSLRELPESQKIFKGLTFCE